MQEKLISFIYVIKKQDIYLVNIILPLCYSLPEIWLKMVKTYDRQKMGWLMTFTIHSTKYLNINFSRNPEFKPEIIKHEEATCKIL